MPWWGALACAVAATLVGFLIDSARGDQLTWVFTVLYFLGCIAAVLMVRNRSLFTAMAQPPLILLIAVPLAYRSFAENPAAGLKGILFDIALPLVDRFPTMVVTTVIVVVIGAFRLTLFVQERRVATHGSAKNPTRRTTDGTAATAAAGAGAPNRGNADARARSRSGSTRGARRAGRGRPARAASAASDSRQTRSRNQDSGRAVPADAPARPGRRRAAGPGSTFDSDAPRNPGRAQQSSHPPHMNGTTPRRKTAAEAAAAAQVEFRHTPRTAPEDDGRRTARRLAVGYAADGGGRGSEPMHGDPAHPIPNVRYRGD